MPINKGLGAFLGTGVIKSNSRRHGREAVNKFGLAFLLLPAWEMTPRSGHGINSTHKEPEHLSTGHRSA